MKKIILSVILLIAALLVAGYFYLYKDHRDISQEEAEFSLSATEIFTEFTNNPEQSATQYLDKTIVVTGAITEIESDSSIVIDNHVYCSFKGATQNLTQQQQVKIKGRVTGYDDLFEQVRIDQCTINQ